VAYVPQAEEVDWSFPVLVEDVVMMGRYGHMNWLRIPRPQRTASAVNEALERVGMTEFRKRQIGELSGGQKKRVFLARALAQEGQVILLDEPFTGVDVKTEKRSSAAQGAARRRPGDAGLHPQPRLGARILRPGGADQGHRPGARADGEVFTQRQPAKAFGGVLRHFVLAARTCTMTTSRAGHGSHR
jgi:manganese/iron transport system ATP-binding protein